MHESTFDQFFRQYKELCEKYKAPPSQWALDIALVVKNAWEENTSNDLVEMIANAIERSYESGREAGALASKTVRLKDLDSFD